MPTPSLQRFLPFRMCVWGVVALLAVGGRTTAYAQRSGRASDEFPIENPVRRPVDASPVLPPALLPEAEGVAALTLDLRVQLEQDGASTRQHQTFSRTADRVHLKVTDGAEWLFVRNPQDRRRVHGYLIDHEHKVLVRHDESELRNGQQIRGWLDVLTLGFDPGSLDGMARTEETRTLGGFTFAQYTAGTAAVGIHEVWWNDTQLLPLGILSSTGRQVRRVFVEGIRSGVDPTLLVLPEERFPSYRSIDLPDWLEER